MTKQGYYVQKIDVDNLLEVRRRYGVPASVSDCHTAVVEGYFLEGHVPFQAVSELLESRPDIAGLALPGMPHGSPGMSGRKTGPFVVLQIDRSGKTTEFGRY